MLQSILDAVQSVGRVHDFTNRSRNPEAYFTDALCDTLNEGKVKTRHEIRYLDSASAKRCDLAVEFDDQNLYLEVKLLFPDYWAKKRRQRWRDRQRLFEPLILLGKTRESHSVAHDVMRLARHQLPDSHHLGVLVVASCTEANNCAADFAEFTLLANLVSPWTAAEVQFPTPFWPNFYLDARIWLCPRNEITAWWAANHQRFIAQLV